MTNRFLLTCEHAGNEVPAAYRRLFRGATTVLASHRGWDPGSLQMAQAFRRRTGAPLFFTKTTRLLVEPNRSVGHPRLFSEFTRDLDQVARQAILDRYYFPHRNRVDRWIAGQLAEGWNVIHVSLHTFTPQLDGQIRNADIGLLYDPGRAAEVAFCDTWQIAIRETRPELRIRRNYPYLGKADGFTTYLRRRHGAGYAGIELEVNQGWLSNPPAIWRTLCGDLAESLGRVIEADAR